MAQYRLPPHSAETRARKAAIEAGMELTAIGRRVAHERPTATELVRLLVRVCGAITQLAPDGYLPQE